MPNKRKRGIASSENEESYQSGRNSNDISISQPPDGNAQPVPDLSHATRTDTLPTGPPANIFLPISRPLASREQPPISVEQLQALLNSVLSNAVVHSHMPLLSHATQQASFNSNLSQYLSHANRQNFDPATTQHTLLPFLQLLLQQSQTRSIQIEATPVARISLAQEALSLVSSPSPLAMMLGMILSNGQFNNSHNSLSPTIYQAQTTNAQQVSQNPPDSLTRTTTLTEPSTPTPTFITLFMRCDDQMLSAYQCLIRKQIELFAAGEEDICTIGQGRNRPVQLGQVGVRCKHCRDIPRLAKTKGAVYFPFKIDNVYQACQNMAVVHLCDNCPNIPTSIRAELQRLAKEPKSTAGGGKRYWSEGIRVAGIVEDAEGRLAFRDK